jgi:Flp pilus assembly protein TadD
MGVAAAVGLAFWAWARAERSRGDAPAPRLVAFGIFFWFVVLSPTSSVVPVTDLAVEHRVYLASLGPFLACVVAVDALLFGRLAPRTARIAAAALALVTLLPLGAALRSRSNAWSSPAGIWKEAVAIAPTSQRIVINLGIVLGQSGDVSGAEAAFQKAWTLVTEPHGVMTLALNHGALLLVAGRPAEALAILDRAIPYEPRDPGFWSNRSTALGYLNRNAEALVDARRAAATEPGNPLFRNMLGVSLLIAGDETGAVAEFAAAEALDPGNPGYPITAAIALEMSGRRKEACVTYRRARATTKVLPLPSAAVARAARLGCPIE